MNIQTVSLLLVILGLVGGCAGAVVDPSCELAVRGYPVNCSGPWGSSARAGLSVPDVCEVIPKQE